MSLSGCLKSLAFRRREVRHAGERRHPGSFSVQVPEPPGFRRNDGNKSRLPVDKFRTPRLGAEGVQLIVRTKRRRCDLAMGRGDDSECSRVLSLIESRAGVAHQLLRAFWTELTLFG
jgi:hypothetical protein